GYGLASHPELVNLLNRVRTPFNINRSAQAAAVVALGDQQHVNDSIALVSAQRDMMSAQLTALGFRVAPSCANFLFFDCGQPAAELAQRLLCDGVI
ncbi:aminotransferase class I/II-fold pyridoxal phosphate-dependent enzyme, partial [Klebsiella pneumoniae]